MKTKNKAIVLSTALMSSIGILVYESPSEATKDDQHSSASQDLKLGPDIFSNFLPSEIKIEYQHDLSREESYDRIDEFLPRLQARYADYISEPHLDWNRDRSKMIFNLEVMGYHVQ